MCSRLRCPPSQVRDQGCTIGLPYIIMDLIGYDQIDAQVSYASLCLLPSLAS